jgi:hypothetical protein
MTKKKNKEPKELEVEMLPFVADCPPLCGQLLDLAQDMAGLIQEAFSNFVTNHLEGCVTHAIPCTCGYSAWRSDAEHALVAFEMLTASQLSATVTNLGVKDANQDQIQAIEEADPAEHETLTPED